MLREEDKENKQPLKSSKRSLTILYASEPEQLHRAIKKGILTHNAHKKAATDTMENLLFRFVISIKGEHSSQEGVFSLVELSSNGLVHFDRSRVKKGAEGLRKPRECVPVCSDKDSYTASSAHSADGIYLCLEYQSAQRASGTPAYILSVGTGEERYRPSFEEPQTYSRQESSGQKAIPIFQTRRAQEVIAIRF